MQAAKPPIRVPAGKRVVKMKMEPLLPMVMTPENVKRAGQTRWLTVEEVLTILRHSPGPFWPLESDRCNLPTSKCCVVGRKRGAYLSTLHIYIRCHFILISISPGHIMDEICDQRVLRIRKRILRHFQRALHYMTLRN
jgi:hypothetical protein